MWNLCISLGCVFQLQKYGAGKHLRWPHNSSPSPNSYSSNDFVIHGWCLAGLFSGTSGDEEPTSSLDICSSILFYSFSLLLQLFLPLNLPCCTSSLLLFAVCTIKEQMVLFLLLHNHFWCALEYIGITQFFWYTLFLLKPCDKWFKIQQHYTLLDFVLQIQTNGALPSSSPLVCVFLVLNQFQWKFNCFIVTDESLPSPYLPPC